MVAVNRVRQFGYLCTGSIYRRRRPMPLRGLCRLERPAAFAVDDNEESEGIRFVGVPIFNGYRRIIAALSLSGPESRLAGSRP